MFFMNKNKKNKKRAEQGDKHTETIQTDTGPHSTDTDIEKDRNTRTNIQIDGMRRTQTDR